MAANIFNNKKTVAMQAYNLKNTYQFESCVIKRGVMKWVQKVRPRKESREYEITVIYDGKIPKVYLFNQGIMKSKNELIPHCYERKFKSFKNEYIRICLYYPGYNEWNQEMFISRTIIPWAIEWLLYYEYWRVTNKWLGGGIEYEKD